MKLFTRVVAFCCTLLIGHPQLSYAQARIKIAIWEFENHAPTS